MKIQRHQNRVLGCALLAGVLAAGGFANAQPAVTPGVDVGVGIRADVGVNPVPKQSDGPDARVRTDAAAAAARSKDGAGPIASPYGAAGGVTNTVGGTLGAVIGATPWVDGQAHGSGAIGVQK